MLLMVPMLSAAIQVGITILQMESTPSGSISLVTIILQMGVMHLAIIQLVIIIQHSDPLLDRTLLREITTSLSDIAPTSHLLHDPTNSISVTGSMERVGISVYELVQHSLRS